MGHFWTFLTYLHTLAGPSVMLLYPLYASVEAIESPSKLDDEQWLAYWILYSFLTLMEMVLEPVLQWLPIWYDMKVLLVAWLVLPQFRGAAFIYNKFVREQLRNLGAGGGCGSVSVSVGGSGSVSVGGHSSSSPSKSPSSSSPSKIKKKFLGIVTPKKGEQEAY